MRVDGQIWSKSVESRFGNSVRSVDGRTVTFTYEVEGTRYVGNLFSPGGKDGIERNSAKPWLAYYDPDAPSVAILNPTPYQSEGAVIALGFLGMLVAGHLFFTIKHGRRT